MTALHRWRLYVAAAALAGLLLAPVMSGFDGKTLGFILGPALVSLFVAARGVATKQKGARVTTLALVVFLALAAVEQQRFLDNTFYLAISLLAIVLFADQVRALRHARDAEEFGRAVRINQIARDEIRRDYNPKQQDAWISHHPGEPDHISGVRMEFFLNLFSFFN